MTERGAFALIDCRDSGLAPAQAETVEFARNLARLRVKAMMAERTNDSAPRK